MTLHCVKCNLVLNSKLKAIFWNLDSILRTDTIEKADFKGWSSFNFSNFCLRNLDLNFGPCTQLRSYGVMVSTLDSESSDPSSSLGRTYQSFLIVLFTAFMFLLFQCNVFFSLWIKEKLINLTKKWKKICHWCAVGRTRTCAPRGNLISSQTP